jgi:hypothetical protein
MPFIDEIGLALLTLLFGTWKNRKTVNYQDGGKPEDSTSKASRTL